MTVSAPSAGVEVRILALGDSYTVGEGVARDDAWPSRLAALLRARAIAAAPPRIIARTGWTTDELSAGIDAAVPDHKYDLVTLLIGVNDQYRGGTADAYRRPFDALLRRAIGFADGTPSRAIVISIPDWSVTPFAAGRDRKRIAAEIDAFNRINYDEATRAGVHYVDVTGVSRRAATEPGFVAGDGLHPSGEMYEAWLPLIAPAAIAAVR